MLAGNRGIVLTLAECGVWGCSLSQCGRLSTLLYRVGARARTSWLPAVNKGIQFASRARGAAPDAAAIRSPSKCSRGAEALPLRRKHGVHADAARPAGKLRDAAALPPAASHSHKTQRALPPNENNLAAAVARRTSKKKGPAHVPHARDWLRSSRAVEDPWPLSSRRLPSKTASS